MYQQFLRRKLRSRRLHIEKLRTDSGATAAIAFHNRFDVLADMPDDIQTAWTTVGGLFQQD